MLSYVPDCVKSLFYSDSVKKNFKVTFPNGEHKTIYNNEIVENSVTLTESLCSNRDFKFGLCESSVLEFQTSRLDNIKDCEIEAELDVDVSSLVNQKHVLAVNDTDFEKPEELGDVVLSCPYERGYKVRVDFVTNNPDLHKFLPNKYLDVIVTFYNGTSPFEPVKKQIKLKLMASGVITFDNISSDENANNVKVEWNGSVFDDWQWKCKLTATVYKDKYSECLYLTDNNIPFPYYKIPYGKFIIDSCKKDFDKKIRKVTAYTAQPWDDPVERDDNSVYFSGFGINKIFKKTNYFTTGLSPLEKAKMGVACKQGAYNFSLYPWVLGNTPNIGDAIVDTSTKANITPTVKEYAVLVGGESDCYKDKNGNTVYFSANIQTYEVELSDIGIDYLLFAYAYNMLDNQVEILKMMNNLIDGLGYNHDDFNISSNTQRALNFSSYFTKPAITTASLANFNACGLPTNQQIIYPYFSGTPSNDEALTKIIIPKTITITASKEISGEGRQTGWNINSSAKFYKFKPKYFYSIPISIARQKINGAWKTTEAAILDEIGLKNGEELTLRDFVEASAELNATFGIFDRTINQYNFIKLPKNFGQAPSYDLTPAADLTPDADNDAYINSDLLSKIWVDDEFTKPWGRVICEKEIDGEKKTLEKTIISSDGFDEKKYQTYDLSDNLIIKNFYLSESGILSIMQNILDEIFIIQEVPSQITAKGDPLIEAGDCVTVTTKDEKNNVKSFSFHALNVKIKGVNALTQTITAEG